MALPRFLKDKAEQQKKATEANGDPMASIVVTMDIKTGDMRIAGNVLADPNLALRMLVEAAHRVMTEKAAPMKEVVN